MAMNTIPVRPVVVGTSVEKDARIDEIRKKILDDPRTRRYKIFAVIVPDQASSLYVANPDAELNHSRPKRMEALVRDVESFNDVGNVLPVGWQAFDQSKAQ